MTHLEHTNRGSTLVASAIVAASVSAVITVSGLLVVPTLTAAPRAQSDSAPEADRSVDAGRAWQRQRLAESPAYYARLHGSEQAGLEWQVRYELTNPNEAQLQGANEAYSQRLSGQARAHQEEQAGGRANQAWTDRLNGLAEHLNASR